MDLTLVKYLTALFMQVQVAINPAAAHTGSPLEVANSAALAVAQSKPLSGISKEELVSVLAVLAWHEGKNNPNAIGTATCNASGDCSSYSTWQLDHRLRGIGTLRYTRCVGTPAHAATPRP